MKCDTCLNRRMIMSENGLHAVCGLSQVKAVECITQTKSRYLRDSSVIEASHTSQELFAMGHCDWIIEKAEDLHHLINAQWIFEPAHKSQVKELLKTIKASVKALEEFIEEQ